MYVLLSIKKPLTLAKYMTYASIAYVWALKLYTRKTIQSYNARKSMLSRVYEGVYIYGSLFISLSHPYTLNGTFENALLTLLTPGLWLHALIAGWTNFVLAHRRCTVIIVNVGEREKMRMLRWRARNKKKIKTCVCMYVASRS